MRDIEERGVSEFRAHPTASIFYVPQYSKNVWRKYKRLMTLACAVLDSVAPRQHYGQQLRRFFDGTLDARAEFRLLKSMQLNGALDVTTVSESTVGGGERFQFDGNHYGRSFLNYLRGLAFLNKLADEADVSSILEIGGGYGTLGEILLKARHDGFYVNVDIPPLAAISTYYLQQIFGEDAVFSYDESRGMSSIDLSEIRKSFRCAVFCSWQLPELRSPLDLFVNFMSFQEMEPHVAQNYVELIEPLTTQFVLMRNSVHGKPVARKPGDLGVDRPITTYDLINMFSDFSVVAKDSFVYGDQLFDASFRSEVICLKRKFSVAVE